MIIGILILSVFGICGLVLLIKGAEAKFYYSETNGEIIGFKESDFDDENRVVGYTPVVKFYVNGKEYSGEPTHSEVWNKPDYTRKVIILYNPQNPETFSLKDNSVGVGCFFFALSVVVIVIILVVNIT